jgi:hypothetical protein
MGASEFMVDCYRLNAYVLGWSTGWTHLNQGKVLSPEALVRDFEWMVSIEIIKPHEKIQYLIGYRRGATGLPK